MRGRHVHEAAEAEINEAALWYENRTRGKGADFIDAVVDAMDSATTEPFRFAVVREATVTRGSERRNMQYRRSQVDGFRHYGVIFTVVDDSVDIIAVAHSRRREGYWEDRAAPK